ncbi:MAG TPA: radical SAM protein [Bryobacteraceae bacterium]|nr:radical SAM protein [Bryobacteraceae bacterium]
MSGKFIRRTLRNVVVRNHPYFAHLALTHRCNLRCRFCHIQEAKFQELDTNGMKRVIDILDEMGVGVLSISGGGEPLLRPDFDVILNHAAQKGLYTKLTSNGTMPRERYERLLKSAVNEIGISLDGVDGNDLPFSHVGPRILETIRYLHDHLPAGKQLTLNVTVTQANHGQVDEIVAYCAREFPNAKVWLNPVVVGDGKLRTGAGTKTSPDYMRSKSPTLLSAAFYAEAVEEQYRNDTYDWGCKAGQMFFDIKPNGDVWICQDQPARLPLNILEPDFARKLRSMDFSYRRECSGCTYSCYFMTQKGLELRHWPQMAGLWWTSNTRPGEPCRRVAEQHGWFSGLLSFCASRLRPGILRPVTGTLLVLLATGLLSGQTASLSQDEILRRMEAANAAREQQLAAMHGVRRYSAANPRLHREASVKAELRYSAPDHKDFRIIERSGSRAVQQHVIEPLMATERANAALPARRQVDICRRNYEFSLIGFDDERGAYVFQAQPRTRSKFLFRGRVWINPESFAIQRIEGEPARSPSFWVKHTHFVHEYARFGSFWFPVWHSSIAELRLFGRSRLVIEYSDYEWQQTGHGESP